MANLKEIRNRIVSINSTKQITAAMKMVSAAKLKRAQEAVTQMRPYPDKLQAILQNLSVELGMEENPYSEQRHVKAILMVLVSSNRVLCGGYNNQSIKQSSVIIEQNTT